MTLNISFDCNFCDHTTDNEESHNSHLLWTHNQWRGYCGNPNKISVKSESESIIRYITTGLRSDHFNHHEIAGLLHRLDDLNWARPNILYTKFGKRFLKEYNLDEFPHLKLTPINYKFSKEGIKTQREDEDIQQKEDDLMQKLIKEVNDEILIKENKK